MLIPGKLAIASATRNPGGDEMAAVLLRAVLPGRNLSWPVARCGSGRSIGDSNRLASACLGRRARDVETRPRPLPSRWRIKLGWRCRIAERFGLLPLGCDLRVRCGNRAHPRWAYSGSGDEKLLNDERLCTIYLCRHGSNRWTRRR